MFVLILVKLCVAKSRCYPVFIQIAVRNSYNYLIYLMIWVECFKNDFKFKNSVLTFQFCNISSHFIVKGTRPLCEVLRIKIKWI